MVCNLIVAAEICSDTCVTTFFVQGCLIPVKVRRETLHLDLIAKGIMTRVLMVPRRNIIECGLNTAVAVFAHPNVHQSLSQPLKRILLTHATRSPRASQFAGSVVCGS